MKIATVLKFFSLCIIVVLLVSTGIHFFLTRAMTSDSRVVNHGGIVRGLTQRTVKLVFVKKYEDADKAIEKLNPIIKGLLYGDKTLDLPQAMDPTFKSRMEQIQNMWEELKNKIVAVKQAPDDQAASDELLVVSENYFTLANQMVFDAENYSKEKVKLAERVQMILFAVNLLLFSIIFLVVYKKAVTPLIKLTSTAAEITAGNLSSRVKINSKDEIGELASTFNDMVSTLNKTVSELKDSRSGLEIKIKERTSELEARNEELKKFNEMFVGRELKMIKLKKELAGAIQHYTDDATK
jgi:methyl-accepting chemotaxis protein